MEGITIQSFNGIGDLLFLTPSLEVIKSAYPHLHITVNTNHPYLLDGNPYVDSVGDVKNGLKLTYPGPCQGVRPKSHIIHEDHKIICDAYNLKTEKPVIRPQLFLKFSKRVKKNTKIGVQGMHKRLGKWGDKKVWNGFDELSIHRGFEPIPHFGTINGLIQYLHDSPGVVCAEGGIQHLCAGLGKGRVVVYGGFLDPKMNGYDDDVPLANTVSCSESCYCDERCTRDKMCYNPFTVEKVKRIALENYMDH